MCYYISRDALFFFSNQETVVLVSHCERMYVICILEISQSNFEMLVSFLSFFLFVLRESKTKVAPPATLGPSSNRPDSKLKQAIRQIIAGGMAGKNP